MKVFIAVDMEGATGIVNRDQLVPDGRGWEAGRRLLTQDVNAVVEGILESAPDAHIRVADGHGIMRNIILEDLHEACELVMGGASYRNRPLCQLEGLDESYDLGMLVGFHSRAGTMKGVLHHTLVGMNICNLRVNGRIVGEVGLNARVMASLGVPVGLVTGNHELEPEARADLRGDFTFVSTKQSLGPSAAICLTPKRTHALLKRGAVQAVNAFNEGKLALSFAGEGASAPASTTIEVETYRREMTDQALLVTGLERTGERSFACTGADAHTVYRTIWHGIVRSLDQEATWLS